MKAGGKRRARKRPGSGVIWMLSIVLIAIALLASGCEDGSAEPGEEHGDRAGLPHDDVIEIRYPGGAPRAPWCEVEEPRIEEPEILEPEPVAEDPGPTSGLPPNELGSVIVLMYHDIGGEEGEWRRTHDNFWGDLEYLWENGYRPVTLASYLSGEIDLPEGMTPVVLTFDDGLSSHLAWKDGEVGNSKPDTAVGMLLEFSAAHPGFDAHAVFYVNSPRPFHPMPQEDVAESLQWLVSEGFEIGNHTHYHANLGNLSDEEVMRVVALTEAMITDSVPDYRVQSLALPYGVLPRNRELAHRGVFDGISYDYDAVLLVGAEPAPSPFSVRFAPLRLPRVRASSDELERWYAEMQQNPLRRYVSDGDPDTVAVPEAWADRLDEDALGSRSVRWIEGE